MIAAGRSIDRHNVPRYYLYAFLMDFAVWAGFWIKYLIDDRGLELRWILAMDLPFWLLVAALQAPMGALADRLGRRRVLVTAGVLYGLVVLGFGLTTSYWMLFLVYALWATTMSMRSQTASALLFESLQESGREAEYTKVAGRAVAVRFAAGVGGLLIGSALAAEIGAARAVQLGAVPPLLAAIVGLSLREPATARERLPYLESLRGGLALAWRHPQIRYTVLIGSILIAGAAAPSSLIQPFLIAHDVPTAWFGAFQTPLRAASLAAALLAFAVARRISLGRLVGLLCAAVVGAYVGLATIGLTGAFALFVLPAVAWGLADPIMNAHLNVRIPSARRATVLSVMPLLFAIQLAALGPTIGYFADVVALRAAFWFAAVYFGVLMPPLLLLWWRAHARPSGLRDNVELEAASGG